MTERTYWSNRKGRGPKGNPTLTDLYRTVSLAALEMREREYFQEWYGYECVDAGHVPGRAAVDLATHIEAILGYRNAWPLPDDPLELPDEMGHVLPNDLARLQQNAEDRIFDIIEFLHDHVSAGVEEAGHFHSYNGCGWHYEQFDPEVARELFRSRVNAVLRNYGDRYVLVEHGEIEHDAPEGLAQLLSAPLRTDDDEIRARIELAVATYRSRSRTAEQQRDAVRNLFDVLEKLRPLVKQEMLQGDERDLFNIANNFTVRHLNELQRGNYEGAVWFSWLFYVNLATIHLITRIRSRV